MRRAGLVALEVCAGLLVVVAVAAGLLLWRLASGEISVAFLTAPIERAINAELGGYRVAIADTVIERAADDGSLSLRLRDLLLADARGRVVARAPKAAIGLHLPGLLTGGPGIRRIDLIGARLAVVYGHDGKLRVSVEPDAGARTQAGAPAAVPSMAPTGRQVDAVDAVDAGDADADDAAPFHQRLRAILMADEEGGPFGGLEAIGIADTEAVIVHEPLGVQWRIHDGDIDITRGRDGLVIDISADVGEGARLSPVNTRITMTEKDGTVEVAGTIDDIVPRELAGDSEHLSVFAMLDLPVSGAYTLIMEPDGDVRAIGFAAQVKAGYLRPPGAADGGVLVDEAVVRVRYDPQTNVIRIDPSQIYVGRSQGIVGGVIRPAPADGPDAGGWRYAFEAREVTLAAEGEPAGLVRLDTVVMEGRVDPERDTLWLDRGELVSGAGNVAVTAAMRPGARSPKIDLVASLSPMPVKTLLGLWPHFAAAGAREWVAANIKDGRISDGTLVVHLADGVIADLDAGGSIPDNAIIAEFGASGVVSSYLNPLPLLWDGEGRGRLDGETFRLDIARAHVLLPSGDKLDVDGGSFVIDSVTDTAPLGRIDARIEGGVKAILEFLDHEPLGYISDIGMAPGDFSGHGQVDLTLSLPLLEDVRLDQVRIGAEAELRDFSAANAFSGHDATSGVLLMKVDNEGLHAAGEVLVNQERANIVWRMPFDRREGEGALSVRMVLDDAGRRRLGIDLPFLQGPVDVTFQPRRAPGADRVADASGAAADVSALADAPDGAVGPGASGPTVTAVVADLTGARVAFPDIAWAKERSRPGEARFTLHEAEDGALTLKDFSLTAEDAHVTGEVSLAPGGDIRAIDFPRFRLSRLDDAALKVTRSGAGRLDIAVSGARFDGRALLKSMFGSLGEADGGASGGGRLGGSGEVSLSVQLDKLVGNEATDLHQVRLSMLMDAESTRSLDLSGRFGGERLLSARIQQGEGGSGRVMVVGSNDAGSALRMAGLYGKVHGGRLDILANMAPGAGGQTRGLLRISDFQIRNETVLGQIASAAPPAARGQAAGQAGAAAAGGGVSFDLLRVPFTRTAGLLQLDESVVRGPTVGATLRGHVDFARDQVQLTGTYLPAFALNNLLSHVPIVGLFMGGKDEGLVGITFAVRGTPSSPSVSINPISAVTPGILRKIFDFGMTGTAPQPEAAPGFPTPPAANGAGRPEQPTNELR